MKTYSWSKVTEKWRAHGGDVILAVVGFMAASFASSFDPINFKRFFPDNRDLIIVLYFLFLYVFVYLFLVVAVGNVLSWMIFAKRVRVELQFRSKPGRKEFGRYLGVYIFNKSWRDLLDVSIRLKDVRDINGKWSPPANHIIREDEFLWGSAMVRQSPIERLGKKNIQRNNIDDTIVDLIHTGDKKKSGKVYFTLQYVGEEINAPIGKYEFDIEIRGTHMMQDFSIPVTVTFSFPGAMELEDISVDTKGDKRLERVSLEFDGNVQLLT